MNAEISSADFCDLKVICDICNKSINTPFTYSDFCELYEKPYISIIKAEIDGIITGYILFSKLIDEGEVLSFAVDEKFRRKGIGKKLLEKAVNAFNVLNVQKVFLEVRKHNFAAIELYKSFGFKIIDERKNYYADKENALVMRLEL